MRTLTYSPITAALRAAHAACTAAHETGASLDEVVARRAGVPRRRVLLGAAAAACVPVARGWAAAPSVAIVGAGLAGLACARTLWQQRGIAASVYEWNDHAGGRVETLRGFFANGIIAEQHAEFISSEHRRMRALAAAYGLTLENVSAHLGDTQDVGWYAGQLYTAQALAEAWQQYAWALFRNAVREAPDANYRHASAQARIWDNMSVVDWVQQYLPDGTDNPLGALCLADVISEYGGPPEMQSALNLIYILGLDASTPSGHQPRRAPEVAGSDEKYHVRGGNDQIIAGMVADLPAGAVNFGYQLLEVRETPGRRCVCTFQTAGGSVEVLADHVVLTIPPTTLRDVALRNIDFSPVQLRALAGATLGSNAKIQIQVKGRPWVDDGYSGTLLTDALVCGGWDSGTYQPGGHGDDADGFYVSFPGGTPGATLARRYGLQYGTYQQVAPPAMVSDTLTQLEPVYAGITAAWSAGPQKAWVHDGNISPYLRGAYSYFQIGQYTSFGGAQSLRAGNLHFAGEHTSVQFQGYMEGAVQSGERAAGEIG
jgi:monoamine oxidase